MADIHVAPGEPALATPGFGTLLDSWRQIIATGNLPKGRAIDGLSRWLLITRACVFSMTLPSGLITKRGLLAAIAAVNLADLAILAALVAARGWPVAAFALAGLFVSVFYVAPPLEL